MARVPVLSDVADVGASGQDRRQLDKDLRRTGEFFARDMIDTSSECNKRKTTVYNSRKQLD